MSHSPITKKEVIRDVSFIIPCNTMTAIVGPSGNGKTTLCNLIARFWDVQHGEIRIGGQKSDRYVHPAALIQFKYGVPECLSV